MEVEEDGGLSAGCGNGKLRQWLIEQIDSRMYLGLVWENDEKSIFRIPWKHAGKQDYNREEDAALFKAWALFKGKYKEGVDKPDPPTWKTRLRCALNKSNDFDELVERSQLDISEPYKVYRIIPEAVKKGLKTSSLEETASHVNAVSYIPSYKSLHNQVSSFMLPQDRRDWRDFHAAPEQHNLPNTHTHSHTPSPSHAHAHTHHPGPHPELQYTQCHYPAGRVWTENHAENSFQLSFHTYFSESPPPFYTADHNNYISDFRLHVSLFYREALVKEVITANPEGCQITSPSSSSSSPPSSSSSSSSSSPSLGERFSSGAETILFPFPYPESQRKGAEMLPDVLEKGVLLWMAPDGLYAKRLCQGRVFWEGPLAPHADKPNKLEKEQPCKLLDTQQFLIELHNFVHNGRPAPRHQVVLCFGDEYPDPQRPKKMITAQVEPLFARKLVSFYQQSGGGGGGGGGGSLLRCYDALQEQNSPPPTTTAAGFPAHKALQHIQE